MNRSRRICSCEDSRPLRQPPAVLLHARAAEDGRVFGIPQRRRRAFGGLLFFWDGVRACAGQTHGVPHISTPVYTLNPSNWQRRSFDRVMGRRIVRNADHVIPQSEHELELLRAGGFEVRSSTVVPFGVDSHLFEQDYDVDDLRSAPCDYPGRESAAYVGKVMSPKGAFDCLEMMARLRSLGRQVRMIMIGDIHDRERRVSRPASAPSIWSRLRLFGHSKIGARIARDHQLADVVLFPSQYEQFGIVALEAAASGRPLLGTPVGIMQTLVPQYEFGLLHPLAISITLPRNVVEVLDSAALS